MSSLLDLIKQSEAEGHNHLLEASDLQNSGDICKHCNGYGSSLQDATDVDKCSVCGGSGLINQSLFPKPLDLSGAAPSTSEFL